ncbi:MAG: FAD-dependent monooxygenase [Sphingobium sp.]|nr:FAD-dependent monooxygenase [Sphingobium sp.]MBP6110839.1 FAD-dependent monooxygenase [Sphingobium sp.]MBP8670017.1 FAD-dependent monooxygenase [Sphingobium sp.]MBP9157118.1 FAD-dependent monooxygenase [Sphingobium sp.]
MRRSYPLILGGGPAGCAAATVLARAGARPLILERTREPQDLVCGGFMSADTVGLLEQVGLSAPALGARPITRLRILAGARMFETRLPFTAYGLSRRRLDSALIGQAASAGAGVERGVAITLLDREARRVRLKDGASVASDTIMLATGKHDLRGALRPHAARGRDPAVGLRARLVPSASLAAALERVIELHVFQGGYAGLLLLEDGAVNLCLSTSKSLWTANPSPAALLRSLAAKNPRLGDRLGEALSTGPWSSIAHIPYGWRAQPEPPGIFRLGDQGAVIASLAGDGMGIGLASGQMAAAAWLRGGASAGPRFQSDLRACTARPLHIAGGLKWLAEHPFAYGPLMVMLKTLPQLAHLAVNATRVTDRGRSAGEGTGCSVPVFDGLDGAVQ